MTFICPVTDETFEPEWSFGDTVTCPCCLKEWETDWDYMDAEDNISAWITGPAK